MNKKERKKERKKKKNIRTNRRYERQVQKISRIQSKSQGKCLEGFCQVFSVNFLQLSKKEKRNFQGWINVNLRLGKGLFSACLNVEKHWNKRCPTFSQLLNSTFLQAPSQSIWVAKWIKLSVKFFAPIFQRQNLVA